MTKAVKSPLRIGVRKRAENQGFLLVFYVLQNRYYIVFFAAACM
jgi:hypothetical protein